MPLPIAVGELIGIPLLGFVSLSLTVESGISVLRMDPRLGLVILGRLDVGLLLLETNLDLDWAWVTAGLSMAASASKNSVLGIWSQFFDIYSIASLPSVNTRA